MYKKTEKSNKVRSCCEKRDQYQDELDGGGERNNKNTGKFQQKSPTRCKHGVLHCMYYIMYHKSGRSDVNAMGVTTTTSL